MTTLTDFFAMQISLIAVVLSLNTYIGLHIIRRGIVFSDLVLDQLTAFGFMVAIGCGLRHASPFSYVIAIGATLVGCALLAVLRPRNRLIPQEAVIGILYGMALVASLMLAEKMRQGGVALNATLTGSMLWVSWPLVRLTVMIFAGFGLLHIACRKPILRLTDDASAWPRRAAWDFLFFVTQGMITILIVPVVGVLLDYGFLMIPAAIGTLFSRRWLPALLIGWGTGFASCVLGLMVSYTTDSPYGPTLLLAMGAFFLAALALSILLPRRRNSGADAPAAAATPIATGGIR